MLVLTIRTDKPEAEIGLFDNHIKLAYAVWAAHRELAVSLHAQIAKLLKSKDYKWHDIEGLVAFKGPGSFTGLRIGLSVANALADSLSVPIVAMTDEDWIEGGITLLLQGENELVALPFYGAEAHITKPKH